MCYVEKSSPGAYIKTGFWQAPRRQSQSLAEILLSNYLLGCPERNAIGMFPIHVGEVAGRTVRDAAMLVSTLSQLVEQGEIVMEGYWIMVPSWWDHNHQPGPGHRERVELTLSAAPAALRSQWEAVAVAAGVYPFGWSESAGGLARGDAGGTPGPTLVRTPGNNNYKAQPNSKKVKSTTTTTRGDEPLGVADPETGEWHDSSAYDAVRFPASSAEVHRPAFVRVCVSERLSSSEAQQLADELSARIDMATESTEFRVEHHEPWLRAVVKKAREAGAPILRAGAKYQREEERRLKLAKAEADKAAAYQASQRLQESIRADLTRSLTELTDFQLAELAKETNLLFPEGAAKASRIRVQGAIQARIVPTGLGQALLARALKQRS